MIKYVAVIFSMIACAACGENETIVHYTFKGVTVTRLYNNESSRFYYGSYSKPQSDTAAAVIVDNSGSDSDINIWMIFKGDSKVQLIHFGDGRMFTWAPPNGHLFFIDLKNEKIDSLLDECKHLNLGMIRIYNELSTEKEQNKSSTTSVQADYND